MAIYIKGATKDELEDWLFSHGVIWDSRDIIYIREPHGRLIDADGLSKKLCKTTIFIKDGEVFQRMIKDTPTVIEGSE